MKGALAFLPLLLAVSGAHGAESVSPYIDSLRRKMKDPAPTGQGTSPYLDAEKTRLGPAPEQSYIQKLKDKHPELNQPPQANYIEEQKGRIAPKEEGGAIQAVKEGRSELSFKRERNIKAAFGFRYGAAMTRSLEASSEYAYNKFKDVYGTAHAPDVTFFSEYQLFHNDTWGSIGLVGSLGMTYNNGQGRFAIDLPGFGNTSQVKFQFFTVPLMVGLNYRMNLAKYVCPFVMAGPTLVGFDEIRSDDVKGNTGNSRGFFFSLGAMIPLDWVSKTSTEDLYYDFGIKRFGLTLEYSRLATFSGPIDFNVSGLNAGLTFEF